MHPWGQLGPVALSSLSGRWAWHCEGASEKSLGGRTEQFSTVESVSPFIILPAGPEGSRAVAS